MSSEVDIALTGASQHSAAHSKMTRANPAAAWWQRLIPYARRHALDALGIALAIGYSWPSTAYRFGRDQALFYYIGREWLNGAVPYRDAFDLKPPGIYFIHALSVALLGETQTAIRVFDVFAAVATGVVAALAVRRGRARSAGELGLGALLACGFYFTVFDYWSTAQSEIWQTLALVGSYALIAGKHGALGWKAALGAGALVGMAGLCKFTAALPALGIAALVPLAGAGDHTLTFRRRALAALRASALFTLGALLPFAIFAAYFAATNALPGVFDMLELLANYARSDLRTDGRARVELFWIHQSGWWLALFAGAWLTALVAALWRASWFVLTGALSAAALFLLCVAAVYAQNKFFLYHWGIVLGPFVLLALYAAPAVRALPSAARLLPGLAVICGGFFGAPAWESNPGVTYRSFVRDLWWDRHESPEAMRRAFTGIANYNYDAQYAIAQVISQRARPGDLLHVRGFELAMYALTGLRTPARFVSEVLFDDLRWATHPEQWAAEQEARLWSVRPRFIVTFRDRPQDLARIAGQGYRDIARAGLFVLFERGS